MRSHTGLNYLLFLPKGYDKNSGQKWPLVLFLHGIVERCESEELEELEKLTSRNLIIPPSIVEKPKKYPFTRDSRFIMVSPQCPKTSLPEQSLWKWPERIKDLDTLLNEIKNGEVEKVAKGSVDEKRIYLTGLSMGGDGAWILATKHPNFAAIALFCALADSREEHVRALRNIPVWIFQGAHKCKPKPVRRKSCKEMVNALWSYRAKWHQTAPRQSETFEDMVEEREGCYSNVRYTIYPHKGHNCWEDAYGSEDFYKWLVPDEE